MHVQFIGEAWFYGTLALIFPLSFKKNFGQPRPPLDLVTNIQFTFERFHLWYFLK